MSPDEARKLLARKVLGGYATGSLTEAERTALFEAALEDQELFDELAGEQVLKEVLDEPGARPRLLAALESGPHRSWWMRPWPWAAAAATVAITIIIVISQRTPRSQPPQEVAQVMKSPGPAAAPVSPPPAPKARATAPAQVRQEAREEKVADQQPATSSLAAMRAPSTFAFNYTILADGFLEIVPAAPGFLTVTASNAIVFPSGAVSAGTPVRIAIPSDAASLIIAFSGMPGITGAPARRDEPSGTVTDQDPPNSRIVIELFLTPATR